MSLVPIILQLGEFESSENLGFGISSPSTIRICATGLSIKKGDVAQK